MLLAQQYTCIMCFGCQSSISSPLQRKGRGGWERGHSAVRQESPEYVSHLALSMPCVVAGWPAGGGPSCRVGDDEL